MIKPSETETAEMRRLYEEEKWSLRRLAAKFGLTPQGVRHRLVKSVALTKPTKMRMRGSTKAKLDDDELRRLRVEEDLSVVEIASRLHTRPQRVREELRSLNISPRPRRPYAPKYRYPELGSLEVGESVEVQRESKPSSCPVFYEMAERRGIRISITSIRDGWYRLTRIG